ncbi:hypothetical protein, partial [Streptococcus pneumoniae]|uniref:hypothetical protein n=1 Tax=Streptococcus pneumoniae TaxID=1313 RepID=UPI001E51C004
NWSNDKRADERWDSKIENVIKSCNGVAEKYAQAKVSKRGEVDFGTCYFRMQGAFNPDNLDSDSIRFQINEEVHAWEAGHLAKARKRTTA